MTLIILPVHNEGSSIAGTLKDIRKWCKANLGEYQILVVNDGSTDHTVASIGKHDDTQVMDNKFDRGKGSALKTAYVYSGIMYDLKEDDNIIFIDGDGQIKPSEIKVLLNIMELYSAEAVIGNKRHKYSMTHYTTTRRVISQTYNAVIRLLFDFKLEDTQCGIKIFKKSVLDKVIDRVNVKQYAFDLELLVALRSIRCRVADAPVTIKEQMNRGSISVGAIIRTFIDTIIIWFKMKRKHYWREHG